MPVASSSTSRVTVVGIGADGGTGISEQARTRIRDADVVVAAPRQHGLVDLAEGQVHEPLPTPLRSGLVDLLDRHQGERITVLASGDPLLSGVGSTLVDLLGTDAVEVVPAVSSVSLARARMGWSAETTEVVSVVGRDPHAVLRQLAPRVRVLVLSSDESTPALVAELLTERGYGASRMVVLGDLGAAEESREEATAATWSIGVSRLNVIALDLDGPVIGSWVGGLPDDVFEHDGQLTKRDLRASALARLAPQPGQLLWDVGAGAGSLGIEWMRSHRTCRAIAVEAVAERAARVARNAASLGVPTLEVVHGQAPESLRDLPTPDAIFVGGGATEPELLEHCVERLAPGGRMVVHGVTLETDTLLGRLYAEHGGELTRIAVEHAAPIGSFTGWTPARAVTQWALAR